MYEFIVLAQLMHGPAHGYLIAKIINDVIGPYARLSYGRLQRLHLIDHYIHYCQAHIIHLQTEAEDMVRQTAELDELWDKAPQLVHGFPQIDSYSVESVVNTMQHFIDQWQLELEWAKRLREREVALVTKSSEAATKM